MGAILKSHIDKLYEEENPTSMIRRDKVISWLAKRCGSLDRAMDILQEVVTNLYDYKGEPPNIESVENFNRYLYGCLGNELSKQKREYDKEENLKLVLEELREEVGFPDVFLQYNDEDISQLRNILDNLNPIDLRILIETTVNGVKCPMLANELNEEGIRLRSDRFTEDSVRQQKSRIIKKIKAQWIMNIA